MGIFGRTDENAKKRQSYQNRASSYQKRLISYLVLPRPTEKKKQLTYYNTNTYTTYLLTYTMLLLSKVGQ